MVNLEKHKLTKTSCMKEKIIYAVNYSEFMYRTMNL